MSGNRRIAKPPVIDTNIPTNEQWYTHHISGSPRPPINFRHRYAIDAVGITNLAHSPSGHGTGSKQGIWATVVTTDHSLGGQPQVRLAFRQQPGSAAHHATSWKVKSDPLLHLEPDVDGTLNWLQTDLASQRNGDYIYAATQSIRYVSATVGGRWSDWQPGFTKTYNAVWQPKSWGNSATGGGWRAVIDGTASDSHHYDANTGVGEVPYGGADPRTITYDSNGFVTTPPYPEVSIVDLGQQALADARAQIPLTATTTRYGAYAYSSTLTAYREGFAMSGGSFNNGPSTYIYDFQNYANVTMVQNYALYKAMPGGYYGAQNGWDDADPTHIANVQPFDMERMTLNQDYTTPPDGGNPWQWESSHASIHWHDITAYAVNDGGSLVNGSGWYINNVFQNAFPPGTLPIRHNLYVSATKNLPPLNPDVTDTSSFVPRTPWLDTSGMTLAHTFDQASVEMTSNNGFGSIKYDNADAQQVTIPLSTLIGDGTQVMFALEPDLAHPSAKDAEAFFEIKPLRPLHSDSFWQAPILGYLDEPLESEVYPYVAPGFTTNYDPDLAAPFGTHGWNDNIDQLFSPDFTTVPVRFTLTFPRWRYWIPYGVIPGHWSDWIDPENETFTVPARVDTSQGLIADYNSVGGPNIASTEQSNWNLVVGANLYGYSGYDPPLDKASWYCQGYLGDTGDRSAIAGKTRDVVTYDIDGNDLNIPSSAYNPSNLVGMQGLQNGVDYGVIPRSGGQYVEYEQTQNSVLGLEATSALQLEQGLIYSNDYAYPLDNSGIPAHGYPWPSPPTDSTFSLKMSYRKGGSQVSQTNASYGYATGSLSGSTELTRVSAYVNYPPEEASTNLYYQQSLSLPSGVIDCDQMKLTITASTPTMTQFPAMETPALASTRHTAFYMLYGGAVANSPHVIAHLKRPRYRYWVPRVTGPDAGARTEQRMKIVRIHPDHTVETRFDHASHESVISDYAQGNGGLTNLYHDLFVSDDATPFIWQTFGDVSGLYGLSFADQHSYYRGVGYWGFPDDGTNQTGGYIKDGGQLFGYTGAYFQQIFLPDGIFAFGPVLVHPWRAGPHGAPELWYFVMNGDGEHATYDIYAAQWGRGNFHRPVGTFHYVENDDDYNNQTRHYPTKNPDGYAFDSNWYRPANYHGRIGPFPNLKVWNRMTGTRELDSIVFPVFKVLRDPHRLGQNHVTVVNGGPLGGQL